MNNMVDIMWGKQTFARGSTQINVTALVAGDRAGAGPSIEVFPDEILERKNYSKCAAGHEDTSDKFGVWYRSSLAAHDGVLLKFQSTVTVERSPYLQVGLLIRLRESGPFFTARIKTNTSPKARLAEVPVFCGRGDVLTPDEAYSLGYNLKPFFVDNFFEEDELEEGLIIQEMGPALTLKPEIRQVAQTDGTVIAVAVPRDAPRKVRIRKKT